MATQVAEIILDTRVLDRILRDMPQRANDLLDLAARRIEAKAKDLAPYDTGALYNSIGFKTPALLTRYIHDGVEYGIYQEKGTSRGVPAHPFMGPAVEAERGPFTKAWEQLIE